MMEPLTQSGFQVMIIGVSQRINVCAGFLTALVRYFWIIKEDRTKDLKVFLPSTAVFVLLSSSLKAFTVTSSSAYFRCRLNYLNTRRMPSPRRMNISG